MGDVVSCLYEIAVIFCMIQFIKELEEIIGNYLEDHRIIIGNPRFSFKKSIPLQPGLTSGYARFPLPSSLHFSLLCDFFPFLCLEGLTAGAGT